MAGSRILGTQRKILAKGRSGEDARDTSSPLRWGGRDRNSCLIRHSFLSLDQLARGGWTIADPNFEPEGAIAYALRHLTQTASAPENGPAESSAWRSENVLFYPQDRLSFADKRYGPRLANLFSSTTGARRPVRRQVLYRCSQHANLLSPDLPCTHVQRVQCSLFSKRCCSGGSGFPSVFALPARVLAPVSGVGRHSKHGVTSLALDYRKRPGSGRRGSSG